MVDCRKRTKAKWVKLKLQTMAEKNAVKVSKTVAWATKVTIWLCASFNFEKADYDLGGGTRVLGVWTLRIEMEAQVGHSTVLAWCGMPLWRKGLAKERNWVQEMMKKQPKKDEVIVAHWKMTKTAYETLA